MSYLARLKSSNSERTDNQRTVKTAKNHLDSFGSCHDGHFQKIETDPATLAELEATANRLCEALGDDAERRAVMLEDCREFPPERWPWLIGYLNGEAARIEQAAREAAITDDRRRCAEGANFASGGRCLAAWRGELSGMVSRRYSPAQPERLRRCEGYAPGPNDSDRRQGRERWPGLAENEGVNDGA
ncbi:MAG: hypothetical protein FIA97_09160 [Methylococcaceae bacterium]|nr:hypothetical protein [Methylococcaceae bacterium]